MSLPITVAHDCDARAGAGSLFLGKKRASVSRQHAEDREVIGADDVHDRATKISFFAKPHHAVVVRQQTGKDRVLVPDVAVSRVREGPEIFWILLILGKQLRD